MDDDNDGRTMEPAYTISSPNKTKGSDELTSVAGQLCVRFPGRFFLLFVLFKIF